MAITLHAGLSQVGPSAFRLALSCFFLDCTAHLGLITLVAFYRGLTSNPFLFIRFETTGDTDVS